jgi:hypothetical protein
MMKDGKTGMHGSRSYWIIFGGRERRGERWKATIEALNATTKIVLPK